MIGFVDPIGPNLQAALATALPYGLDWLALVVAICVAVVVALVARADAVAFWRARRARSRPADRSRRIAGARAVRLEEGFPN
jgi:hypothetical protein